MKVNTSTLALTIDKPTFKLAGIFTLNQTEPIKQILKQYEIFGMKVEASPQKPLLGSDVTLSCTISRLSDTVNLHWRPIDSSQPNRGNTDQIRLDNAVYLMVRHVTVEDGKLYVCEVRENGNILHTSNGDFTVNKFTAELSDVVTEGDNVTLTCSVSHVLGSMRLVWINGDGKRVGEKTLTWKEKSPSLVIQKAERGRGNWRCVLFHQDLPRLFVPYYQKDSKINVTPVPEMSRVTEYMSVSRNTKQEDTEEGIHYGSISFQPKATGGNSDNTLSSNQASGTNLVSSKEDESVIYAETAKT
ncbi:uncharacterized protein LOC116966230 [Amblyraja radiata]|uniref:uncharacterized protein LOC116966230 n=1 Tax=Amblyraja radiata TaxID=386614 RepID=UPI0014034641|nr:uncharacterized protein LOC116966230 [Amblyraja radiata]